MIEKPSWVSWLWQHGWRKGPVAFTVSANMHFSLSFHITPLGVIIVVGPLGFQVDWNDWYWDRGAFRGWGSR